MQETLYKQSNDPHSVCPYRLISFTPFLQYPFTMCGIFGYCSYLRPKVCLSTPIFASARVLPCCARRRRRPPTTLHAADNRLITLSPSSLGRRFVKSFVTVSPAKNIVVTTLLVSVSMEMLLGRYSSSRKSVKSLVSANGSRAQRWIRPKSSTLKFRSHTLAGRPTALPQL
jgi:hypothetical protein